MVSLADDTDHILWPRYKAFAPLVNFGMDMTSVDLQVAGIQPASLGDNWSLVWVDRTAGTCRPTRVYDSTWAAAPEFGRFYLATADHSESFGPFEWRLY